MSLIVDMLKKLNKEKPKNTDIPPSLKQEKEKKNFLPYILGIFLIITVAALGFIYYLSIYTPENVVYSHKVIKHNIQNKQKKIEITEKPKLVENKPKQKEEIKKEQKSTAEKFKENREERITKKQKNTTPPPKIKFTNKKENKPKKITSPPKIIDDKEYLVMLNQANFYLNNGNYKEALKIYEKLIKYKKDQDILNNLLILYVKTGQENKIYNYLSNIDKNILFNVVLELIKINKIEKAMEILNKADSAGIKSYLAYAVLYEKEGYLNKAYKYYKKAYESDSENPLKGYYFARALEIKGKYKDALKIYKKIYDNVDNENLKNIIKNRIKILSSILR